MGWFIKPISLSEKKKLNISFTSHSELLASGIIKGRHYPYIFMIVDIKPEESKITFIIMKGTLHATSITMWGKSPQFSVILVPWMPMLTFDELRYKIVQPSPCRLCIDCEGCLFLYWLPFCLTLMYFEIAHPSKGLKGHFFLWIFKCWFAYSVLPLNMPRHAQTKNAMLLHSIYNS